MGIARLLILVGIIGFAAHWWNNREVKAFLDQSPSPNGFVSAAMPDGARSNTILILAPLNCPSAAAQRADALSNELGRRGIPNVRSSSYNINIPSPTAEQRAAVERAVAVLKGEVPAVFVNGMAKANPSLEEVVSEYERTK